MDVGRRAASLITAAERDGEKRKLLLLRVPQWRISRRRISAFKIDGTTRTNSHRRHPRIQRKYE